MCHAEEGAKIAEKILKKTDFPEEKHEKVLHAIKTHRHSQNINPKTREAEILQDADRLDALGAITIARMFSTGGKMHRPLYNPDIPIKEDENSSYSKTTINGFYEKILKIKPNTFKTKKAIGIASERYKFVEEFLDRFLREWDGEA